jgi:hypothetical protein
VVAGEIEGYLGAGVAGAYHEHCPLLNLRGVAASADDRSPELPISHSLSRNTLSTSGRGNIGRITHVQESHEWVILPTRFR